ncbi:MAG: hypothetical protein JRH11_05155 [Deltaproteobacteria bacterium]|nr:hypothetical protein [Deltaproteobacteria bacterium]
MNKLQTIFIAAAMLVPTLMGCAAQPAQEDVRVARATSALDIQAEGSFAESAVLAAADGASVASLDDEVPLDSRAANNIVAYRQGPDGIEGTDDDGDGLADRDDGRIFDSIAELDGVAYVGGSAIERLYYWATVKTLDVAERSSLETLDESVPLDARSALNIVVYRQGVDGVEGTTDDGDGLADREDGYLFDSIEELDAVAYVGPAALAALVRYAVGEPEPVNCGLLWVANHMDRETLGTLTPTANAADAIVAYRLGADGVAGTADDGDGFGDLADGKIFDDEDELLDVAQVGPATAAALSDYAVSQGLSVDEACTGPGMHERFASTASFDLAHTTLRFTPERRGGYTTSSTSSIGLPEVAGDGTIHSSELSLADDDSAPVSLVHPVQFYGVEYDTMHVGSNGNVTFGAPDTTYFESVSRMYDGAPRIAMLWDDLNPRTGGTVTVDEYADRVVVTFDSVPEWFATGANTFQLVIHQDGSIVVAYGDVSVMDGLVGLSDGNPAGLPAPTGVNLRF